MVTVVRHCAPEANLTLTAAERRRVESALAHAKEWRHPAGPLIQADLDVLTQALRAARWTHFLAAHMVGPTADDWYVDPTTPHDSCSPTSQAHNARVTSRQAAEVAEYEEVNEGGPSVTAALVGVPHQSLSPHLVAQGSY